MMAATCGFSSASSSSTEVTSRTSASSMPLITAPHVTVAKKTETARVTTTSPTTTQPRKVVKCSTEPNRDPKKAKSVTRSSREVTIQDVNNNSKAMKRLSSESPEVVVTKKQTKRRTCFMTGYGLLTPRLKKHVIGMHLTLVFSTLKEIPREEQMFFYNQLLISLERALGLNTHEELLQMVVGKQ